MTHPLPDALPNQSYVTFSAICGGHLTLPDSAFVSPADAAAKRYVPSLSFLITHPGLQSSSPFISSTSKPLHILFDLGLRQQASDYLPAQQKHLETRNPYELFPGVPERLRRAGVDLDEIDAVVLSHVHYDHHGDPEAFTKSKFFVGPGSLAVLKNALPPELGTHQAFTPNLLPTGRTEELPAVKTEDAWKPLGPFPHSLDLLGDGSIFVIDAPGHLPGHVNLLCRIDEKRWVCFAGDAFHDGRLLTGEKEIGTWESAGWTCCIHLDRLKAEESIARLRELKRAGNVEIIAAHDEAWELTNEERFL